MFKLLGSPHSHIETPLTGSTAEAFIKRAVSLGRTHFSYTDHNYMSGAYKLYGMASKAKLKFVPGVEVYFKDFDCEIIRSYQSSYSKYFKITLYAPTQEIYQKLAELSSEKKKHKISLNGEEYGLWNWNDLERAAAAGCVAVSSEINDIVGKHFLLNSAKAGLDYFSKIKSMFGANYYICIVGNVFDKYSVSAINFTLSDETQEWFFSSDYVTTEKAKKIKAFEVFENPNRHAKLLGGIRNGIYFSYNKEISKIDLVEGNIPIESGDLQLKVNKALWLLSIKENVPVIYSDYAYYAEPSDKAVQDVRLYPENKKEYVKRHMQSSEEAFDYLSKTMGLSQEDIAKIESAQLNWLGLFDGFKLKYDINLPEVEGGKNSLQLTLEMVKASGRMKWTDPVYQNRLKKEIDVLYRNGTVDLLPYFFPIKYVLDEYKKHNKLVGAGRGSAAGSLLLYCMGITNVDPIRYGLSFERFLSLARVKTGSYPDVDTDLPSRELLVGEDRHSGFLYGRWGDKASQISTRTLLRLKSSIKDVNRYFNKGKVDAEIESLTKALPSAPQGISDLAFVFGYDDSDGNHTPGLFEISEDLQNYVTKRPKEWEVVQKCLGISRQTSVHASAFVLSDRPIKQIVPLFNDEFTQYEAKEVEKAGLIKLDFLVVKQLEDVQLAIDLINKKSGVKDIPAYHMYHKGNIIDVQDFPEELDVFKQVWEGETSTIFQLNTSGMASFTKSLKPKTIEDIALILALYRPGPLDFIDEKTGRNMAEEYVERRFDRSKPDMQELAELVPETYGIMVYQEQVSRVSAELGGMQPEDAEELRRVFSKKDKKKSLEMKPVFMEGAVKKLGQEKAEKIWGMMEAFSRYGFNKSHAVSYAILSYQSMYLKYHYPLEWWTAVLSNADEGEISTDLFKYVKDLIISPDINFSGSQMSIDYEKQKIRAKLGVLKGAGDKSIAPIVENAPYKDIEDYVRKDVGGNTLTKRLIHVGAMDSLFPSTHTLLDKMQDYEDAVLKIKHEKALASGKKVKTLEKGKIDETYLTLSPLKDFQLKKTIYPTIPSNLTNLFKKFSKKLLEGSSDKALYSNQYGETFNLYSGYALSCLDPITNLKNHVNFCVVGFVVDVKEFVYAKNTKKALKVVFDSDGYLFEKVMWPDYNTGKIDYPKEVKKGSICLFFLNKRASKFLNDDIIVKESGPSSIIEIYVESI